MAMMALLSVSIQGQEDIGFSGEADGEEQFSYVLESTSQRDIDGIRRALDDGESIDVTNVNGWTAASFAVAAGDIETLHFLIEEGIDLNLANNEGYTPLMLAALQSDKEMVELLLNSNADPSIHTESGTTAYTIAKDSKRLVNAHIILEAMAVRGIYNDDANLILNSIKEGAYVNIRTGGGWNPLIWAAANGNADVASELIQLGANVNHVENEGWSPLHFAAFNGHMDIVKLLLDQPDIDPQIRNTADRTPRDLATEFPEIVTAIDSYVASHAAQDL